MVPCVRPQGFLGNIRWFPVSPEVIVGWRFPFHSVPFLSFRDTWIFEDRIWRPKAETIGLYCILCFPRPEEVVALRVTCILASSFLYEIHAREFRQLRNFNVREFLGITGLEINLCTINSAIS